MNPDLDLPPEVWVEVFDTFWDRFDAEVATFVFDRSAPALVAARRIGHQLAGSAALLGFDSLSQLGREIEDAAKAGDGHTVALALANLRLAAAPLPRTPFEAMQQRQGTAQSAGQSR